VVQCHRVTTVRQVGQLGRRWLEKEDMVTENYSLRLDSQRRNKLENIARKQDRDLAYIIRKAIDEYIERHQHEVTDD
jgi:hypothetical protein